MAKPPRKASVPAEREAVHPLFGLRRDIDRLFDDFFRGFPFPSFGRGLFGFDPFERFGATFGVSAPVVDVTETDKQYEVIAELPGMDEKDIEVTLAEGRLTIKGEKKQEKEDKKEDKKKDYYLMERRFGSFNRSIRLPENVNEGRIQAAFKKGVLTITLPKKEVTKKEGKKIEIEG